MDLHVILTIGEYAFKRIMTGWFLRVFIGAAILLVGILFIGNPDPQQGLLSHRTLALSIMSGAAVLLVIVMGATEIPRDIDTRVIMIILSKPLTKADVVVGKFIGLILVAAFTVFCLTAACALGCLAQKFVTPEITKGYGFDVNMLQKAVFAFFEAVIVAGVVIFLSTRLSEIPIIFFSGFYLALGYLIMYLPILLGHQKLQNLHWFARWPVQGIYYLVPNLWYLQIPPQDAELGTVPWLHLFLAVVYAMLYAVLFVALAIKSFEGRQVAG